MDVIKQLDSYVIKCNNTTVSPMHIQRNPWCIYIFICIYMYIYTYIFKLWYTDSSGELFMRSRESYFGVYFPCCAAGVRKPIPTRWAMNIAVTKIDIERIRYHFHVLASQLSGDVISNRLWRHQWNENTASEAWVDVWKSSFLSSFMDSLCCPAQKCILKTSWREVVKTGLQDVYEDTRNR